METTMDKFINSDPHEKELFDKEYNDFLLSESLLEKMEAEYEDNIIVQHGYKRKSGAEYRRNEGKRETRTVPR